MRQLVEKEFKFEDLKVGMEVYNSITEKWFEVLRINEDETNVYPISTIHRSFTKDGKEHVQSCVKLTKMRYEEEIEYPGDTYRVDLCPTCNWLRADSFCRKREFYIKQNWDECEVYQQTAKIKEECEHTFNLAPISNLCSECDKREGMICTVNDEQVKPGEREFDCHNYKNKYKTEDVNGSHYAVGSIETIDVLKQQMTEEQFEGFLLGNILKYGLRCNHKGSKEQDLKKVLNYAHKLVEKTWFY